MKNGAALAISLAALMIALADRAPADPPPPEKTRVRELVIVDSKGRDRIKLWVYENKKDGVSDPRIELLDKNGERKTGIFTSHIRLDPAKGKGYVSLSTAPNVGSSISVSAGKRSASLTEKELQFRKGLLVKHKVP